MLSAALGHIRKLESHITAIEGHESIVDNEQMAQNTRQEQQENQAADPRSQAARKKRFYAIPKVTIDLPARLDDVDKQTFADNDEPVSVNLDSLPIPAFINEVYGNLLGLSFEISSELQKKDDLVTLRITEPQTPKQFYKVATRVLEQYGVKIATQGDVLRFYVGRGGVDEDAPILLSGTALPEVPSTHRPVFYYMDLETVNAGSMTSWLRQIYTSPKMTFVADNTRNAIWIKGSVDDVIAAAESVKTLDQPLLKGRYNLRISPQFIDVVELANKLTEVLQIEGYSVGSGKSVIMLPLERINSLLIFSNSPKVLPHIKSWVLELDKPVVITDTVAKSDSLPRLYYHHVRNGSAADVSEILNQVLQKIPQLERSKEYAKTKTGQTSAKTTTTVKKNASLVVDRVRNAIVFYGTQREWQTILPIIKKMDKPPRMVMVEVTISEIKLTENSEFGVDWLYNVQLLSEPVINQTSLTILGGSLTFIPTSNSGKIKAVLRALAADGKAKIMQNPRILVRSGQSASINVGADVPIASQLSNSGDQVQDGDSTLIQQIEYRSTGVLLNVNPIIYEGGRVDLTISQEVSTSGGGGLTPTIANRNVSTVVSLQDGESIMIAGLLSKENSEGNSGVPYLRNIPGIGDFFATQTSDAARTELMILIVPYVIDNRQQAQNITNAIKDQMVLLKREQQLKSQENEQGATESKWKI